MMRLFRKSIKGLEKELNKIVDHAFSEVETDEEFIEWSEQIVTFSQCALFKALAISEIRGIMTRTGRDEFLVNLFDLLSDSLDMPTKSSGNVVPFRRK